MGSSYRKLSCKLTQEETLAKALELVELDAEIETLDAKLGGEKARHKDKTGGIREAMRELRGQIRSGEELRMVECLEIKDFTNRVVSTFRSDTGVKVDSRVMSFHELQKPLFGDGESDDKNETEAETEDSTGDGDGTEEGLFHYECPSCGCCSSIKGGGGYEKKLFDGTLECVVCASIVHPVPTPEPVHLSFGPDGLTASGTMVGVDMSGAPDVSLTSEGDDVDATSDDGETVGACEDDGECDDVDATSEAVEEKSKARRRHRRTRPKPEDANDDNVIRLERSR